MKTMRTNLVLGLAAMLGFAINAGRIQASDLPEKVEKAQELIEMRFNEVIWFGHRSTTNRDVQYDGARKLDDGYALTFTFRWDGDWRKNQYTKIRFLVDNAGRVSSLSVDGTTCINVPFESDLRPNDLQLRRSMVAKHPRVKNSVRMLEMVNSASARQLCLLYLNLELGQE